MRWSAMAWSSACPIRSTAARRTSRSRAPAKRCTSRPNRSDGRLGAEICGVLDPAEQRVLQDMLTRMSQRLAMIEAAAERGAQG